MRSKDVISIDFGQPSLKIAHIKCLAANKKEITTLIHQKLIGTSDADIAKEIASSLALLKIKAPHVVDIIPSQSVITKNIEIPSVHPQEIREIISLQAGRHTPYSREEVIVDYIDLGTFKRNYTKVLLVIVNRSVIKRHSDILEKAGLKLQTVYFAPEAVMRMSVRLIKQESDSPYGLIHIDETTTDFIVASKQRVLYVRSIPTGAVSVANEKEKASAKLVDEIKKSLEAFAAENIERAPSQLIFTGAVREPNELEAVLSEAFKIPSKSIYYLKHLPFTALSAKVAGEARELSFLQVIAPVLYQEELKVNLIPEEIRLKRTIEERARDLLKTGALSLTVLILIFMVFMSKVYVKGAYLKKLQHRYAAMGKDVKELENTFSRLSLIKKYLTQRGFSLDVLYELYAVIPAEMELDEIKFDSKKFSVKGTADSMSMVFAFVDGLEKSKFFKEVKTKYTTKRKEGKRDVTDFEVASLLEK